MTAALHDDGDVLDLGARIAEQSRRRHASFSDPFWAEIVEGPAARLAASLAGAGSTREELEALLRAYLELAAEGMGAGLLFPASAGADSFFTLAFLEAIPAGLAGLPRDARAPTLASCFNLGENLGNAPLWLRRIFVRLARRNLALAGLDEVVARVEREALAPPARRLGAADPHHLVSLADEDPRFLPGAMHFAAPTVLCVHDRHRTAAAGRPAESCGVWLADPPVVLGSLACREEVRPEKGAAARQLARVAAADRRVSPAFSTAANDWRAAASLVTSQMVVALVPAA